MFQRNEVADTRVLREDEKDIFTEQNRVISPKAGVG